jgi:phosphatidylserine/phosphatidylglycerophosphate/cardiolipin synthase-like enzyme
LLGLAARGAELEVLTEASHRRVPPAMERRLAAAGIPIRRVLHAGEWIPMHNKFALVETREGRWVIFGSFNWSEPSRRLNREVGVVARDPALYDAFAARWKALWSD